MRPDIENTEVSFDEPKTHAERVAEVFRRKYKSLRKQLLRKASADVVEDILAQAFQQVLARPLSPVAEMYGYIWLAAKNLLANHYRHQEVRRTKLKVLAAEETETGCSLEASTLDDERRRLLVETIQGLPPQYRLAFRLRFYEELSNKEIVARFAEHGINITERTVLRYIDKVYDTCRQVLERSE
jgi:RNA polymerase sigma factor (sigma-70 family)